MKLPFGLGKNSDEHDDSPSRTSEVTDTTYGGADPASQTQAFPAPQGGRAEPQHVGSPRGRGRLGGRSAQPEPGPEPARSDAAASGIAERPVTERPAGERSVAERPVEEQETSPAPVGDANSASSPAPFQSAGSTPPVDATGTADSRTREAVAEKPVSLDETASDARPLPRTEADTGSGAGDKVDGGRTTETATKAGLAGAGLGAGAGAAAMKSSSNTHSGADHLDGEQATMNNSDTTAFPAADYTYEPAANDNATTAFTHGGYNDYDNHDAAVATGAGAGSGAVDSAAPVRRGTADFGLFVLRLIVGAMLLLHSLRIVFGVFNGPGIDNYGQILADSGFSQTGVLATVIGVTQLIAAILLILGLAMPVASSALLGLVVLSGLTLIAAAGNFTLLGGSDMSSSLTGGLEVHILYIAALLALLFTGGGKWGMDFSRKWAIAPKWSGVLWLIIVVIAVAVVWYLTNGTNPLNDTADVSPAR